MKYPKGEVLAKHFCTSDEVKLIQKGGQKAVYRATLNGQTVALKLISPGHEKESFGETGIELGPALARARREVAVLEQVDVPVLAKIGPRGLSTMTIGETKWIYFTEEWIEGKSLRELIIEAPLHQQRIAQLGVDLIWAVCWLSSRNLIHRDIKPENVMWAVDRSRFVLLDPGIALDLSGPSLTAAPVPIGTMPYFSPEQTDPYRKRDLDFRSDLFAVGVVLYESSLAEHPFMPVGVTPAKLLDGIHTLTPRPLANRIAGFPLSLSNLISRLMGKNPHLRYRTCALARTAVENIVLEMGTEE